jgi:hypothetical protein
MSSEKRGGRMLGVALGKFTFDGVRGVQSEE